MDTILQEAAPDLIIADIAPTLRLAVGGKVPMIVVGNGYTVLPRGRVSPPSAVGGGRSSCEPRQKRAACWLQLTWCGHGREGGG